MTAHSGCVLAGEDFNTDLSRFWSDLPLLVLGAHPHKEPSEIGDIGTPVPKLGQTGGWVGYVLVAVSSAVLAVAASCQVPAAWLGGHGSI